MNIICTNCRRPYPETGAPYRCPKCHGLYDFAVWPAYVPPDATYAPGIWRYRAAFGLPDTAPLISLGEGNTPLVWANAYGRQIAFKCEMQNPSGSFKDRGAATLVSFLCARKVNEAIEDSSGNAGAAFAAYAARAGLRARVFVPEAASGPKRRQIAAYGAQVVNVPGPRSNAAEAVRQEAETGIVYASHASLPFNLPGYATLAYEIVEQLGRAPGTLILPAGQGGLLLGAARGFAALRTAGRISQTPHIVGVQARACAPLWALSEYGPAGLQWVTETATAAEGVRVHHPLRGDAVLAAVEASGGKLIAVEEPAILPGRDELASRGFYVEPTSAIVWDALAQLGQELADPVVVVLTGSGLKSS